MWQCAQMVADLTPKARAGRCTPSAERAAAVSAVRSLQQACSAAAIPEELGQQTGAVLKRKRSQPVRSSSMKALKSEAGDMVIS